MIRFTLYALFFGLALTIGRAAIPESVANFGQDRAAAIDSAIETATR